MPSAGCHDSLWVYFKFRSFLVAPMLTNKVYQEDPNFKLEVTQSSIARLGDYLLAFCFALSNAHVCQFVLLSEAREWLKTRQVFRVQFILCEIKCFKFVFLNLSKILLLVFLKLVFSQSLAELCCQNCVFRCCQSGTFIL